MIVKGCVIFERTLLSHKKSHNLAWSCAIGNIFYCVAVQFSLASNINAKILAEWLEIAAGQSRSSSALAAALQFSIFYQAYPCHANFLFYSHKIGKENYSQNISLHSNRLGIMKLDFQSLYLLWLLKVLFIWMFIFCRPNLTCYQILSQPPNHLHSAPPEYWLPRPKARLRQNIAMSTTAARIICCHHLSAVAKSPAGARRARWPAAMSDQDQVRALEP